MPGMRMRNTMLFSILAIFVAVTAAASVSVPSVIGDHMVLQQGIKVPIWGKADPGETVTVTLGDATKKAVAGADGRWMVKLPKQTANGKPLAMAIAGKDSTISLNDILVGEVWVASGQSNMQWAVKNSNDAEQEIAAAGYPAMRLLSVTRTVAGEPQDDCEAKWEACTPETIPMFSAVAYFFGRELHKELDVPVGLIHTSWGGTPAESWTTLATLENDPMLKPIADRWDEFVAHHPRAKRRYDKAIAKWRKSVEKAKEAGGPEPKNKPTPPLGPGHPHRAAGLYNAMIAPLVPFAIQGAIWYQGESNADRAYQYATLFPAMIQDWRNAWDQGPFPFLFVQLANFTERLDEPGDSNWAELREAQSMTLSLKNTGMAVIIDIGEAKDIHPRNKQDVGRRLALGALANTYCKDIAYSGPVFKSMRVRGGKALLSFTHANGGLVAKGGGPLTGFAIAGDDEQFVWGNAEIVDGKVAVSASGVPEPAAVRYAWANNPECNLCNGAGLPASPFRTDDWPGVTIDNR